jgi:S-methylmethionine-dependent homocysteine/selenocysteine methylase
MSRDVANGLADSGVPFDVSTDDGALRDGYRRQAEVLAAAGSDVIVLEMMGSLTHAAPAVAAAAETGLPIWLGISVAEASPGHAMTIDDEGVAELIMSLPTAAVDAVFVMHSDIGTAPDSLAAIRAVWPGVVGAYPHVGEWRPPNWVFHDIQPEVFADRALEWVAAGATIVGGCCGTGPEHIASLARRLASHRP